MPTLLDEIASLLYMNDNPYAPWSAADEVDHLYYMRAAEVVLDAVVTHLQFKNEAFDGALSLAAEYLSTQAEVSRLRRVAP